MSYHPFLMGANILAYQKEGMKYGMCCSWAQMIDYDKIAMLIGATSSTGKSLAVEQTVGVSALASEQTALANHFGTGHSDQLDKFESVPFIQDGDAILIKEAKVMMKCCVKNILALPRMEEDYFVIMDILSYQEDQNKVFLDVLDIIT
jgi:flavin reductase (DIM6/NTAB) family NADH-FMN oxidoreductase RutF